MKKGESINGPYNDMRIFNWAGTEGLLWQRFFITSYIELYGDVACLFRYRPAERAVKNNLIVNWKQAFFVKEYILKLEAWCITSGRVLEGSGLFDIFHD